MLEVCSAHVPCEALRRKTRTSDAKRPRRHSEELEAGPRVAIILVFNIAALALIYFFEVHFTRLGHQRTTTGKAFGKRMNWTLSPHP